MIKPQRHEQPSLQLQEVHERERLFLERARAGEDIRDEVVLFMQGPLTALAHRIHWRYSQRQGNVVEVSDLVQSASVEVLACFSHALLKEKPFGYLYHVALITMFNCVNARGQIIKAHPDDGAIPVLSLDRAVTKEGLLLVEAPESHLGEKHFFSLHKALEMLPEMQRTVVQRRFGLFGSTPASLNQIGRELYPGSVRPNSTYQYKSALAALRQALSETRSQQQAKAAGGTRS